MIKNAGPGEQLLKLKDIINVLLKSAKKAMGKFKNK